MKFARFVAWAVLTGWFLWRAYAEHTFEGGICLAVGIYMIRDFAMGFLEAWRADRDRR